MLNCEINYTIFQPKKKQNHSYTSVFNRDILLARAGRQIKSDNGFFDKTRQTDFKTHHNTYLERPRHPQHVFSNDFNLTL